MYRVIKDFTDKNDHHVYVAGDEFPRDGVEVSAERVAELASTDNVRGEVLIEAVDTGKIRPVSEETEGIDSSSLRPKGSLQRRKQRGSKHAD